MMNFFSANGVSNLAADISFTVLAAVLSVAAVFLAVWLLTKYIRKPKYAESFAARTKAYHAAPEKAAKPVKFNFTGIFLAIIGFALIIRVILMFTITGYREDFHALFSLLNSSLTSTYAGGLVINYPVPVYIYSFLGLITRAAGLSVDSFATPLFIKLPLIAADIGLIYIVYRAAKKHINEYVALILAGFIAVFPPFILASGVWGSVYSLLAVFLVLTFYFMANKNFLGLFIAYALALFTVKDALYLFPVVAVFVIYQLIKAIKYVRTEGIKGFKNIIADPSARPALSLPLYIVASWLLMWLVALPLMINFSASPFQWMYLFYFKPLGTFEFFGYNALNVFNLFLRNGSALGTGFPRALFGALFMVIITALVLLVYLSRKNRANMIYLAAYILLTLSVYFIDFTATNLVAVLALLILSLVFLRDKRILMIAGMLGLFFTLNASFVMMSAGYLNALTSSDFGSALYTGVTLLGEGSGWLAANIVCSVGAVLTHAYATIVILDIAMSNKRKLFAELDEPVKFGPSLLKFFKG